MYTQQDFYFYFQETGKFKPGNQRNDDVVTIDGLIGRPLRIECPEHEEGIGHSTVWGSLPEGGEFPTILKPGILPSKNIFYGQKDKLIFQALTLEEVKHVDELGGVSCILYLASSFVTSRKIKIKPSKIFRF